MMRLVLPVYFACVVPAVSATADEISATTYFDETKATTLFAFDDGH